MCDLRWPNARPMKQVGACFRNLSHITCKLLSYYTANTRKKIKYHLNVFQSYRNYLCLFLTTHSLPTHRIAYIYITIIPIIIIVRRNDWSSHNNFRPKKFERRIKKKMPTYQRTSNFKQLMNPSELKLTTRIVSTDDLMDGRTDNCVHRDSRNPVESCRTCQTCQNSSRPETRRVVSKLYFVFATIYQIRDSATKKNKKQNSISG